MYKALMVVGASLALTAGLYMFGVGMSFASLFAIIFLIIGLGVFYHSFTTDQPASGTTPARPAYMGPVFAGLVVAFVLGVVVMVYVVPQGRALFFGAAPEVAEATVALKEQQDILAGLQIKPNDSGYLMNVKHTQDVTARNAIRWQSDELQRIDDIINKNGYTLSSPKYAGLMKEKGEVNRTTWDELLRAKKAVEDAISHEGGSTPDKTGSFITFEPVRDSLFQTLRSFPPLLVGLIMACIGLSIVAAGFKVTGGPKATWGKTAGWAIAAGVIFFGVLFWKGVYGNALEASNGSQPVTVAHNAGPVGLFIAGDDMPTYEKRWVKTGIQIDGPIRVSVNSGLANGEMHPCLANGCDAPQLPGPRIVDQANHMAILGRIENGKMFLIGNGTEIDPANVGIGELQVTTNQIKSDDAIWKNMNGGFNINVIEPAE